MDLTMETVSLFSQNRHKVKDIYTSSFRKEDRMPFLLMLMMACLRSTKFISFCEEDMIRGFGYLATINKITFVMFFAVDEHARSKGYGSRILNEIQSLYPNNKIIITIESCDKDAANVEERLNRKKFYLKNGYVETGYMVKLGAQKQEVLIKNGKFNKREFILFFLRYSNLTMIPKVWKADI